MSRELLQQALELLEHHREFNEHHVDIEASITALRAALAQPAEPVMGNPIPPAEPVAWQQRWTNPGNYPNVSPEQLGWNPLQLKGRTEEDTLREMVAYRYNGLPCYEVRALYDHPPAHPPIDSFGGNLDSAFDAPGGMVMVPRHLSVDELEAFVGHGLCCGTEPMPEAVINAGHRWTRLLGRIAAAPAQPAPAPDAKCDGGTCGLGGYCADCPKQQPAPAVREPLNREQQIAIREAHCNTASDAYFGARPILNDRTKRNVYEAGFKEGWEHREFARAIEAHHGITGDGK